VLLMAASSGQLSARARTSKNCDPELFRVQTDVLSPLAYLSTGIAHIDAVMPGGGLPLQHVVEIVGPPASGKTRLCCAASLEAAAGGSVLFIETRAANIVEQMQLTGKSTPAPEVLANVHIVDVHTMDDLVLILSELLEQGGLASEPRLPLRLLVVDCFTDLAVPRLYAHARETGLVCAAARLLAQVVQQLGSCVLTTNTTVRGEGPELHKAALKATTGPSAPQMRVLMSKCPTNDEFYAQVVDSVDHAVAASRGGT
jgi:predicted ATP-dependent serine protease